MWIKLLKIETIKLLQFLFYAMIKPTQKYPLILLHPKQSP